MATIEELQAQLAALTARVDAITTPPETYYTMLYQGETIDAILTDLLPARAGGAGLPVNQGGTGANTAEQALINLGAMPTAIYARTEIPNGADVEEFLKDGPKPFGYYFVMGGSTVTNLPLSNNDWWFLDYTPVGIFAIAAASTNLWFTTNVNFSFGGWSIINQA